tara:strand:- start:74 stop:1093 length:1020 start_codon:yes stop_codon:yes gene_type:complete
MIIESIHFSIIPMIQLSFLSWGIGMMLMRVCSLPFIIRHTDQENSSEALSLSASTWSLSTIFSGLIISTLDWVSIVDFGGWTLSLDERSTLWIISIIGSSSILFAWKIKEGEQSTDNPKNDIFSMQEFYDWKLIFKAISPLILISIGAGLTIPFVNLFFNSVFSFSSSEYSIMGSLTAILVFIFSLMVPTLRKKYGYWMTIVVVQSLAIGCLVIMSLTEIYVSYEHAAFIAVAAYIMRQPLMHMAHPASNELMMNYVGKNNQELISALSSSLWSASWFVSAKIFEWLRLLEFQYYEIFLITALLYTVGVILYSRLIKEYELNQSKAGQILPITDKLSID